MDPAIRPWASALAAYLINEDAASAAEYALTLAVLGGCALIILHVLGARMGSTFNKVASFLNS
ncbi:MAG TPA: hypothetical protein VGG68_14920 [Caulobacteraceae bacterium]|jgi:Flp pilus assembly pilin Flp